MIINIMEWSLANIYRERIVCVCLCCASEFRCWGAICGIAAHQPLDCQRLASTKEIQNIKCGRERERNATYHTLNIHWLQCQPSFRHVTRNNSFVHSLHLDVVLVLYLLVQVLHCVKTTNYPKTHTLKEREKAKKKRTPPTKNKSN